MPRTWLIDSAPCRDDDEVLCVLEQLPPGPREGPVFTFGLLNEVGVVYREVELQGEYEVLQFTARMNSRSFVQLRYGDLASYAGVFCKPASRASPM